MSDYWNIRNRIVVGICKKKVNSLHFGYGKNHFSFEPGDKVNFWYLGQELKTASGEEIYEMSDKPSIMFAKKDFFEYFDLLSEIREDKIKNLLITQDEFKNA